MISTIEKFDCDCLSCRLTNTLADYIKEKSTQMTHPLLGPALSTDADQIISGVALFLARALPPEMLPLIGQAILEARKLLSAETLQ